MSLAVYAKAGVQLTFALALLRTQPDEVERDRAEISVRRSLAVSVMISPAGGLASTAVLEILEAYSASRGKASAYLPVIELLRNYFDGLSGEAGRWSNRSATKRESRRYRRV